MTTPTHDDDLAAIGMAGATAKLYVIAALDEAETAHRAFGAELRRIRAHYVGDLSEPDRFKMLRQAFAPAPAMGAIPDDQP